jgi:hypothetical protein
MRELPNPVWRCVTFTVLVVGCIFWAIEGSPWVSLLLGVLALPYAFYVASWLWAFRRNGRRLA